MEGKLFKYLLSLKKFIIDISPFHFPLCLPFYSPFPLLCPSSSKNLGRKKANESHIFSIGVSWTWDSPIHFWKQKISSFFQSPGLRIWWNLCRRQHLSSQGFEDLIPASHFHHFGSWFPFFGLWNTAHHPPTSFGVCLVVPSSLGRRQHQRVFIVVGTHKKTVYTDPSHPDLGSRRRPKSTQRRLREWRHHPNTEGVHF